MSTSPDSTPTTGVFQPLNYMTLPDAALAYAQMGFKVFPLQPNSKLPLPGWSWRRAATSDLETVRSWWRQWPVANIGLALGAGSGVDALDIDVKNGQDGLRSYQAITQDAYRGPVQHTPTNGQHLLFLHTPGLRNFTHRGQLGGLDMRTDGGYIVAAPSTTPAGEYYWQKDGPVPAMPHAILAACQQWSTQDNTQLVDAPEIPEDLPGVLHLGLGQKYLDYLERGDTSAWNFDESTAVFATAGALMRRLNDAGVVFGVLCANPHAWACAQRHRPFGDASVWLWKYGIAKIVSAVDTPRDAAEVFSPLPLPEPAQAAGGAPQPAFFVRGSEGIKRACIAPQWVVRGLLEQQQVGLVYGDSQALKSYLMLDLSVAVSVGGSWHGHDVVSPGAVWFLAGEGNAILWRRLEALRQSRHMHSDTLGRLWLSSQGLNLMNAGHLQYLKSQVALAGGEAPRLLVVDTLSSNAVLDENNAKDAAELISICYKIAQEWACTVVLVHHVGKGNKGAARGSSVLQTNTDFRLRVERAPGQRIVTQLFVEKLKGAPEPRLPLSFEAHAHTLIGVLDDDMVPVSDLVLERVHGKQLEDLGIDDAAMRVRLTEQQAEVYGFVKGEIVSHWTLGGPGSGMLREELYDAYRTQNPSAHKSHFDRYLDKLVNHGLLEIRTEGEFQLVHLRQGKPKRGGSDA